MDLLKCLLPPPSIFPTVSQLLFDEICAGLTSALLLSMKDVLKQPEYIWQDFLCTKPVNVVTWPYVAHELLRTLPAHLENPGVGVVMIFTYCSYTILILFLFYFHTILILHEF